MALRWGFLALLDRRETSGLSRMLRLVRRSVAERELEEVGDAKQAEEQADERGHRTTTLVVEETGPREPQRAPARFQRATTTRQDVMDTIRVRFIG